jgi:glycerol-3-phosphate acyltransferase PlsY
MFAVALAMIAGYLLGSIPFGLLLTRAAGLGDVRQIGSGNIGATNVLRTGNKMLAALTLLLDGLKGTAAVLVGSWIGSRFGIDDGGAIVGGDAAAVFARVLLAAQLVAACSLAGGLGAFLGHVFPVWLGFKGGKGVATYIGVLIGFAWPAALVFAVVWLATAVVTRYSSLSALVATVVVFIYLAAAGGPLVASAIAALSALLIWTHRENIRRLAAGTESKIGAKG